MPSPANIRPPRRPRLLRGQAAGRPPVAAPAGAAAETPEVDPATLPRAPWWKRTRPLVTAFTAVVGTVSAGLGIWAWVSDRLEPPLTVSVEHSTDPCGGWVIPKPPDALGPVPPVYDPDDLDARPRWADTHGGADANTSYVDVTVQGTGSRAVILTGLRVDVVSRAAPLSGTTIREQCGDALWARYFDIDLDREPPAIAPSVDKRQEVEFEGAPPDPIDFPYTVTEGDPEWFTLVTSTVDCYCEWTATLEWKAGDDEGTSRITDGGKPFRTSASTTAAPAYGNYAGGPLQPWG